MLVPLRHCGVHEAQQARIPLHCFTGLAQHRACAPQLFARQGVQFLMTVLFKGFSDPPGGLRLVLQPLRFVPRPLDREQHLPSGHFAQSALHRRAGGVEIEDKLLVERGRLNDRQGFVFLSGQQRRLHAGAEPRRAGEAMSDLHAGNKGGWITDHWF
jgi:hypothetical protein